MKKPKPKPVRAGVSVPMTPEEIAHFDQKLAGTERSRAQQIRLLLRDAGFLPKESANA